MKYDQVPARICVSEACDKAMPIGGAYCETWDQNGLVVRTIRIGKEAMAGRWVMLNEYLCMLM